jgi:hypothetical protein
LFANPGSPVLAVGEYSNGGGVPNIPFSLGLFQSPDRNTIINNDASNISAGGLFSPSPTDARHIKKKHHGPTSPSPNGDNLL